MLETKKIFTLTKDHIKLLKRSNISWNNVEFGAPTLDPKRPYGNSSVLEDIHQILTGESINLVGSKRDSLTNEEEDKYNKLHDEIAIALQVVLSSLSFKPGKYILTEEYGNTWKLMKKKKGS